MVAGPGPNENGHRRGHFGDSAGTARPHGPFTTMIGIPVTAAAYEAIKGPLTGQRGSPPLWGRDGLFRIWLDCKVVDEFGRLRGPGETYSDVILRLAKAYS